MSFTSPQDNIDQFDLDKGMYVADLGAGTGAYTIVVAKKVGDEGRVNAVEVQQPLLGKIRDLAVMEHLFNVEVIWGDIEKIGGTKLRDSSMDAVIISNVLFQLAEKGNIIKEANRILKPNRRVLFIEWSGSYGGVGPALEEVVPQDMAKEMFVKNGFEYEKDIFTGDNHYGMIFRKKDEVNTLNR
ncbi:MAG: class I SAM-dependent methyltransferase [Patescibacteria group bacterium]|nr:class I SAM-dependent methyltransferase [Patescibacteria group bacterium]